MHIIKRCKHSRCSASSKLLGVSELPVLASGRSGVLGLVALNVEASVLLTGGGKTTELAFVVLLGDDPVDSGVLLDGVVSGVNKDDLEELVGGILTNPVGVEDTHVGASAANLLLSNRSVGSGLLELSDTLMDGLTVDNTLADSSLTATSSDADTVDRVALLGLPAERSSLIESGRSSGSVDNGELSILPRSDTHDESAPLKISFRSKVLENRRADRCTLARCPRLIYLPMRLGFPSSELIVRLQVAQVPEIIGPRNPSKLADPMLDGLEDVLSRLKPSLRSFQPSNILQVTQLPEVVRALDPPEVAYSRASLVCIALRIWNAMVCIAPADVLC